MSNPRQSNITQGSNKSIHMMLKEVEKPSEKKRESKLVGVTQVEELLMDHQDQQSVKSDPQKNIIVGLDDALM